MLGERARDDLDLAWDEVFAAAAETGTLLEIDGSDHRLDLAPERARRAVEAGCRLTIDSDAHRTEELAGIDGAWRRPAVRGSSRRSWRTRGRVMRSSRGWPRSRASSPMSGNRPRRPASRPFGPSSGRRRPPLATGRPGVPVAPPTREGRTRDPHAGGRPSGPGVVGRALPRDRVRPGVRGRGRVGGRPDPPTRSPPARGGSWSR